MKIVSAIVVICAVAAAAEECAQDTFPHQQAKGTPVVLKPVPLPPPYKVWNISIPAFETCSYVGPTAVVVSVCDNEGTPAVQATSLQTALVERSRYPVVTEATVYVTVFCDSNYKLHKGVVVTPATQVPTDVLRRNFDSVANNLHSNHFNNNRNQHSVENSNNQNFRNH